METEVRYSNAVEQHVDSGFVKAFSHNLPIVNTEMIWSYFMLLIKSYSENPENATLMQNFNMNKIDFSDDSICFVQIKRDGRLCIVKGQIMLKVGVENKSYHVSAIVDEEDEQILSGECNECFEGLGDCKHAVSFIMWLHRRSEANSANDIVCYFRNSLNNEMDTQAMKCNVNAAKAKNFVKDIVKTLQTEDIDCPLRWNYTTTLKKFGGLSIHEMIMDAVKHKYDINSFMEQAKAIACSDASNFLLSDKTKFTQRYAPWYLEMRYARITSAKVSDCINANLTQAVLYETILGCHKEIDQILQNKKLAVRQRLEKYTKTTYDNCKIVLNAGYPVIFDVPDGICQSHVIEIKCPKTRDHMNKYVTENGSICEKYYMEIQIHMYLNHKTAGVVCVADPDFEINNEIYMHSFNLNRNFAASNLNKAVEYWKNIVYPELIASWTE